MWGTKQTSSWIPGQWIQVSYVRQHWIMSPWVFVCMNTVMKEAKMGMGRMGGKFLEEGRDWRLPGLLYVDDLVLFGKVLFLWMYMECNCSFTCSPSIWQYWLLGFSFTSGGLSPGSMFLPWVTAFHFLAGNREAGIKPTTFSSLLLLHVFLSFLFSWISSYIVPHNILIVRLG